MADSAGEGVEAYESHPRLRDAARVLAVLCFVCTAFTAAGAIVLIGYTRANPDLDAIQLPGGLLVRAVLFSLATAAAAAAVWALRGPETAPRDARPEYRAPGAWGRPGLALVAVLVATAVLLSARVSIYPWAAPDEVHHLVVARNLALHGSYASGHPDAGFLYFDSFDSVGPTVIAPIALAFRAFGLDLAVARHVMVAFFLLLCLAQYFLARRLFAPWTAVASVALLVGTVSSTYLGRTLYGEVPAYAFLLLGLLAWGAALERPRAMGYGLLAGFLVAAAVLTKTILALVAFSFLGAWLYDRATDRAIRWPHVLWPVAGGLATMGAWALIQRWHAPANADPGGVLAIYQHYLLFGVGSAGRAFQHAILPHPVTHLAMLAVLALAIASGFRGPRRLPALVLLLFAVFMGYWWFFFTPGHLHRYLWNSYAILALFAAPWLCRALAELARPEFPARRRIAALACAILLAAPQARWIAFQAREIATNSEMHPEYALIGAVEALPADQRIATDVERLPGLLHFFAGRRVETGEDPVALLAAYDTVIARDSPALRGVLHDGIRVQPAGAFVLLSIAENPE
ncbi:MAG: glycosyltransferase family 39 protein [Candidatus Hydrogenedentes bacterium]|nr:glycosyltransferase family 39 protein [Candidatus Hydrogenedentota bacterium]